MMTRSTDSSAEIAFQIYIGSPRDRSLKLCVLYSELADPDWPDELRFEKGAFIYYGDNKRPGHELHDNAATDNCVRGRDTQLR